MINTSRLEAFSDGILAIIITIMVLEMHKPSVDDLSSLVAIAPSFLAYVLSVILAFVEPIASYVIFILVAALWIVPDKRVERLLESLDEKE